MVFELVLRILDQWCIDFSQIFDFFSELVILVRFFEVSSCHIDNFVAFVLSERIEQSLVQRIITQYDLVSLFDESLDERWEWKDCFVLTSQVVDLLLTLFHPFDILVKRTELSDVVSSVPSSEDWQLFSVIMIFNHT